MVGGSGSGGTLATAILVRHVAITRYDMERHVRPRFTQITDAIQNTLQVQKLFHSDGRYFEKDAFVMENVSGGNSGGGRRRRLLLSQLSLLFDVV
jgi:hypothetical protein